MKRLSFKAFEGIKSNKNDFSYNLVPSRGGESLDANLNVVKRKQKGDSNLANLDRILDFTLSLNESLNTSTTYIYAIDASGYIYKGDSDSATILSDFVEKALPDNDSNVAGNKVSIIQSLHGDILWTSHKSATGGIVGRAWTGVQDGGTSATVLTDGSETFDNKVFAGDKVYNLTDGSSGTVTSVSGSTVTCSGGLSGGSDNQWENGDKYELYASNYISLTKNATNSPTGSNAVNRSRQMVNFEDATYLINDNYLEQINSSLTYNDLFLQLHIGYIGECMAVNGNRLLVGANRGSNGKLHLWDGFSADWLYKLDLDERVQAIKAYRDGWIVVTSTGILFTDGYRTEFLDTFPDLDENDKFTTHMNAVLIRNDKVYISGGAGSDFQRNKTGIWVYLITQNSWAYLPYAQATGMSLQDGTPGVIFYDSNRGATLTSYTTTTVSNPNFISTIDDDGTAKSFYLFTHDFGRDVTIHGVSLDLEPNHRFGDVTSSPTLTIRGAFSAVDDVIWIHTNHDGTAASAANLVEVSGGAIRSAVDQAVLFLEGQNGGDLDFISSIANQGQATEQWTLNNNQTGATEANVTMNLLPFYESEEISVTLTTGAGMTNPRFEAIPPQAQYGRRFGAMFWFNPSNFPFKIKAIHIDYDDGQR